MDLKNDPAIKAADRLILGPLYPDPLTLLDRFALAALPAMLRDWMWRPPHEDPNFDVQIARVSESAWKMAEAMLAERARRMEAKR